MYDTVNVPCPKCGTKAGFQSKGGDCVLAEYELSEAPVDVLSDVMRHGPATCKSCETVFGVSFSYEPAKVTSVNSVLWPPPGYEDEDDDELGEDGSDFKSY